ncbi:RCC1 domain-containing protein [Bacillus cihuensis]|uniref:RCC1 domain-containing protein n=1 Tax=Bacillus cihuensis TaxID=1208599 RepID=UPI0004245186|nr:hypothetical protein [Bacillus cihuensis]
MKLHHLFLASSMALSVVATVPMNVVKAEVVESGKSVGINNGFNVRHNSFVVSKTGNVYVWGEFYSPTPTSLTGVSDVKEIFHTTSNTYFLTNSGDVYAVGANSFSQAGSKSEGTNITVPIKTNISNVQSISGNGETIFAVTNDNEAYAWGNGGNKVLGLGTTDNMDVPTKMNSLSDVKEVKVSDTTALAVTLTGEVYVWGNYEGTSLLLPKKIEGLSDVKTVSVKNNQFIALKNDSTLYSWGKGANGTLGHGDVVDKSVPTKIEGISDVKSILMARHNAFALTNSGDVYSWGKNSEHGILGHGDLIDLLVPKKISTLSNIKEIYASSVMYYDFMLALTNESEVYGWGGNDLYQLGLGDNAKRISPTKIPGLTNISEIISGGLHSLAITKSSEIYAWGYNHMGQIGLGNKNAKGVVPTKVEMFQASEPDEPTVPTPTEINKDAGFSITNSGLHLEVDMQNLNPTINPENISSGSFAENIADVQSLKVKDFTGIDEGWSVYVSAKQIEEVSPVGGFKEGTAAIKLPTGVLSLESSLVSTPIFNVNTNLSSLDSGTPQKFAWAAPGAGAGENNLPSDGDFKVKIKNLSSVAKVVDPINYPDKATPYQTTVKFTLVQGEL